MHSRTDRQIGVAFATIIGIIAIVAMTETIAHADVPIDDLSCQMTCPASSDADTDVAFDVTLTNLGPDTAAGAIFDNPVPAGASFVSVTQVSGPAFSCTDPVLTDPVPSVHCTDGTLAAGESADFIFVFHIFPATPAGTFITNEGTVSIGDLDGFDPSDENDTGSATTQTPPPPLADVRIDEQGPTGAQPDTDVTYTIVVTNNGRGDATDVELDDTLPNNMTFVSLTLIDGVAFMCTTPVVGARGTITCDAASFASGASVTFMLVGHIPPGTGDGTDYEDFATIASTFDPDSENDTASSLLCVQADGCAAGPCNSNHAVICALPDQCHEQGTCDAATGVCAPNPARTDGSLCNDGDPCTLTDSCQAGVCVGGSPMICPAAGPCQIQGTCDIGTGVCAPNLPSPDGSSCDDGNACSLTDVCESGACLGFNFRDCPPSGPCENQGTCDSVTGGCIPSFRPNGFTCSDGNACTQGDSCQAGVCAGASTVICPPAGQCEGQGACDTETGVCAPNVPEDDGTVCDDGDACTQTDSCRAGVCAGDPVVCPAAGPCEVQGTCDALTGECGPNLPANEGMSCDEGSACTQNGACLAGVCTGTSQVTCPPAGQCEVQGTCDSGTGVCAPNLPAGDGATCDDGNACTRGETCGGGTCHGGIPVDCDDHNSCTTDTCDPVRGCVHAALAGCDAGVVADASPRDARPPSDAPPSSTGDARLAADGGSAGASDAGVTGADAASTPTMVTPAGGCACRTGGGEDGTGSGLGWLVVVGLFGGWRLRRRIH